MKKLIIVAHPSAHSTSHKIAEKYAQESQKHKHEIQIINVYDEERRQEFLNFQDMKDITGDEIRTNWQEKITWAHELIFVFPIWRAEAPAILKNWIDVNLAGGFAYEYRKRKPYPLLKGRTARIFATCDGPSMFYKLFPIRLQWVWWFRLTFCGISLKSCVLFGDMRSRKKKDPTLKAILNKVTKVAQK